MNEQRRPDKNDINEVLKKESIVESIGVVDYCTQLNIRKEGNVGAEILEIVNAGEHVSVNISESTNEWYRVKTKSGINGFCMKEYISIME